MFALGVLIAVGLGTWATAAEPMRGTMRSVDDGDSFQLCQGQRCVRVRLCGIDAPERRDARYAEAKTALRSLLAGKPITCRVVGNGTPCDGRSKPKNRDRSIAQCFLPDGSDVAAHMVRRRLACDWETYSGGHYARTAGGFICSR